MPCLVSARGLEAGYSARSPPPQRGWEWIGWENDSTLVGLVEVDIDALKLLLGAVADIVAVLVDAVLVRDHLPEL